MGQAQGGQRQCFDTISTEQPYPGLHLLTHSRKFVHLGSTSDSYTPFEIRLVNGLNNCSGRVELFHDGQWGTVCDDNWDMKEANVVCHQLDCGEAKSAPGGAHFGSGDGPIWWDDVHCTGTELSFSRCIAKHWGENNCNHGEDAGVICSGRFMSGTTLS